jgi:nicotinate-nucleotide--dimethylbenzimidazole phosphoribosyltransferase
MPMITKQTLQHIIDHKTKPVGSLGLLETIALQAALVQQTAKPVISKPTLLVFAADHGIAAGGLVNPYPQAVTAQMLHNFVHGGAAINVFCRQHHINLMVIDAGVNTVFDDALPIVHAKIAMGTADYSIGVAMTEQQANTAIEKGAALVQQVYNNGCNTIAFGEMGIGNTSAAALIMHHYTGLPVQQCTGKGTGSNTLQLLQKIKILETVVTLHQLTNRQLSPCQLLSRIGGFEIAMIAGAFVKAYQLGMLVVVDGFIVTAALLVAQQLLLQNAATPAAANLLDNCIFAHVSGEEGHSKMLQFLQATPLLQLGMRLGEGTGAALAIPLLQSAVLFLNEMASFESAGVQNK